MPVTIYPNPNDLVTAIVARIKANGLQEITGPIHQDVLLDMLFSILYYFNNIPTGVMNQFPVWNAGTTYQGGVETVVRYDDKLWLFVSATDDLGSTPGTNAAVWVEINALQLAHFRNKDQYLDETGPYQVSAQEIREHIDNALIHSGAAISSWLKPIKSVLSLPPSTPAEGDRHGVSSGATGAWTGQGGKIATWTSGAWAFEPANNGDVAVVMDFGSYLAKREYGSWIQYDLNRTPTLYEVLGASANSTGPRPIHMERPVLYDWYGLYHGAAGAITLPTITYPRILLGLSADVELGHDGVQFDCELAIYNDGASAQTITYGAGLWEAGNGLPTLIAPGEVIILQVRGTPGGLATIIGNSQFMRNALNAVLDDDETAAAYAVDRVMTQRATVDFVKDRIAEVVNGAGTALDTLLELAAALGNDPNFAASVATSLAGKQPLSSALTSLAGASADGQELVTAANYAAMRALLGLVVGTNVQAQSSVLTTLAGASSDGQSLVTAASFGVMRTLLGLVIGTNVQAQSSVLTTLAGASANGQSLITAADYAAMRALLGLVVGTNVQAQSSVLTTLAGSSANGQSLITAADYAAMQTLMGAAYNGVNAKSANFTVAATERGRVFNVTTGASNVTATLPAAATAGNGFTIVVRKADTGIGTVVTSPATGTLLHASDYMVMVSDGTNWMLVHEPSAVVSTYYLGPTANSQWTDQPSTLAFMFNMTRAIRLDLTNRRLIRMTGLVHTIGHTTAKLILRYRTAYSTTASDYLDMSTECSISLAATGGVSSGWVGIPSGAQGDVYLTVLGSGGNGTADPLFSSVNIDLH